MLSTEIEYYEIDDRVNEIDDITNEIDDSTNEIDDSTNEIDDSTYQRISSKYGERRIVSNFTLTVSLAVWFVDAASLAATHVYWPE